MSIQASLQILAQVNPKAFQELDQQLTKYLTTAGASLTLEQIMFVKDNFKGLPTWLETAEGKLAVQTFVQDWIAGVKK